MTTLDRTSSGADLPPSGGAAAAVGGGPDDAAPAAVGSPAAGPDNAGSAGSAGSGSSGSSAGSASSGSSGSSRTNAAGSNSTGTDGGGPDGGGAGRAGAERLRRMRRPAPSRRLSRLQAQRRGPREVGAREAGLSEVGVSGARTGEAGVAEDTLPSWAVSGVPLGVLIGGSPGLGEAAGVGARGESRRVAAELVRAGQGTCQVVLPDWRPAIAVSVPTERLLAATGLELDGLAGARLTVLINPDALHDRELGLRDWRAEH